MTRSLRALSIAYLTSALLTVGAVTFLLLAAPASAASATSSPEILDVLQATTAPADSTDGDDASTDSLTTDSSSASSDDRWDPRIGGVDAVGVAREHGPGYVGHGRGEWPYNSSSVIYRDAPPIRYNRVEGLTIGIKRDPLDLTHGDRARVYGQAGFATELNRFRYTVGTEVKAYAGRRTALKFGVAGYQNTVTEGAWKTSYLENSLGGLIFGHDFFNYYQARGLTVYGIQDLPRTIRVTAGLRTELHDGLENRTGWSIFDGDGFGENPLATEGRATAAILAVDAGRVRDLDGMPTGGAFRVTAELAHDLGLEDDWLDTDPTADLRYNRYTADGRVYLPTSDYTRLSLRLRGGYATSGTPIQKQFFLGGIGSVRGYGQNAFVGTRSLLGNAEFLIDGATILDDVVNDVFLALHVDAGWAGQPGQSFRIDDVVPAAGFGIGLDERSFRLDVTWPLRDVPGAGSGPAIWLRITPHF